MKTPLISALARRGFKADAGIVDTLPAQAKVFYGEDGKSKPNPTKNTKPQVTCWCERRVMPSTWQRIYDGVGETCGARGCHAPKEGTGA